MNDCKTNIHTVSIEGFSKVETRYNDIIWLVVGSDTGGYSPLRLLIPTLNRPSLKNVLITASI